MSELTLTEGSVFAGRYKVVRCMAMGGMGAVYEVLHIETDRRRALKVMLPHVVANEELRGRFRQEARVAAHVESEFIVDVFDAGVDDTTQMPFLVMELLRGEELGKRLQRVGRFHPKDVIAYLQQTAFALDKTHRASIVHRDLKPENLFLTDREDGQPRVKVLDFGIAKIIAEAGTSENATRSLGTPLYMAPEQFRASGVSAATDIYSLGMVAFTFLVGSPYWLEESRTEGSVFAFAMISIHGPPEAASVRARRRGVELPPAFDAWFAQMTAVQPSARFASAGGAIQAMAEALGYPLAPPTDSRSGAQPPVTSVVGQSGPFPQSNTSSDAAVTKPPAPSGGRKTRVALGVGMLVLVVSASAFLVTQGSSSAGAHGTSLPTAEATVAALSPKETVSSVQVSPSASAVQIAAAPSPSAPTAAPTVSAPAAASAAPVAGGTRPGAPGSGPKPGASSKPAATAKIYSQD